MSIPYELEKDKSISGGSQSALSPIPGKNGNEVVVTPALGEKGGLEGCKLRLKRCAVIFWSAKQWFAAGGNPGEGTVHRSLKQRHMAMIALGGMFFLLVPLMKGDADISKRCYRYGSLCRIRFCIGHWWTRRFLVRIRLHGPYGVS